MQNEQPNIGPSLPCDMEEFKRRVARFSKAAPTLASDELENGFKAVGLSYLGLPDTPLTHAMAPGYLHWATKHYTDRRMELDLAGYID